MNAQNPHPGVSPGIGHEKDWVGPLFAEEYARGYAETTLGVAAGPAGRGAVPLARNAVTASRFVAATDFTTNFSGGLLAGRRGFAFEPTVPSTAAKLGAGLGYATGVFDRVVGVERAIKAIIGVFD